MTETGRRKIEPAAIWGVLIISGAAWAFLKLASEISEGETDAIDRMILLAFRNAADAGDPIGPPALEEAIRDISGLGGFTIITLATLIAAALFWIHGRWRYGLVLIGTVSMASVTSEIAKAVFGRARPDEALHGVYVYSGSFPSGHTTLAAATYLTLAMLTARCETHVRTRTLLFACASALVVMIGFSRIYLGVHWPTDVIGGLCLGSAWTLAARTLAGALDRS